MVGSQKQHGFHGIRLETCENSTSIMSEHNIEPIEWT